MPQQKQRRRVLTKLCRGLEEERVNKRARIYLRDLRRDAVIDIIMQWADGTAAGRFGR